MMRRRLLRKNGRNTILSQFKARQRAMEPLERRELLAGDLVAHWVADQSVEVDDSGRIVSWLDQVAGISAQSQGNPRLGAAAINGRSSIVFDPTDGDDGFRVHSSEHPLAVAEDFSVAITFRTDSNALRGTNGVWYQNTGLVDANALGFSRDWGISINANGQIATGMSAGFGLPQKTMYSTASGLNDGQLRTVVVTRQAGQMAIYVDELAANVETGFSADPRSPVDMTFGILQSNAGAFPGEIAQIRLYDGSLTSTEVASLQTELDSYYNNSAPVAANDSYVLQEDPSFYFVAPNQGVLSNDSDPDGDTLTAVLVTQAAHGQVVLNPDGGFVYSPNPNFNGTDSFTYTANDFRPGNVATVTFDVQPVYDPPVPQPDNYKTTPTALLQMPVFLGVSQNDTNVDNARFTAVVDQPVSNGSLTLRPDGSFTYDPQGFAGVATFTYRLDDGISLSAPGTVTIVVNTPPTPRADGYTLDEDGELIVNAAAGILANDIDVDGNPLTLTLASQPTHGTLEMNPDGSFRYVPEPDYSGEDQFTYSVSDGVDESAVVTVLLTVQSVNDEPIAANDAYVVSGTVLEVPAERGVLQNDSDIDSPTLTATLVESTVNGQLSLSADGSFRYRPRSGFFGQDRFTYRASDGTGLSSLVEVILVSVPPSTEINDPTGDSIVTFNELMYNPVDSQTRGEWVELHNQMGIDMDVSGWRFTGAIYYEFPAGTVIPGNGYLVVSSNPAALAEDTGFAGAIGPFSGRLSNDGEELILRNNSDRVMDIMEYEDGGLWPVGPDGSGATLAKIHGHAASGDPASWQTSLVMGGSPGRVNDLSDTDPAVPPLPSPWINEFSSGDAADLKVELWNPHPAAIDLTGYRLGSYEFPATMLQSGAYLTLERAQLGARLEAGDELFLLTPNGQRVADAIRLSDRLEGRDPANGHRWFFPTTASFGAANVFQVNRDIVINEIMYHAPGLYVPELDKLFDNSEQWLELFNRSQSQTIDLSGWSFGAGINFTIPAGTVLGPGEYLVISNNPEGLLQNHPGLAASQVIGSFDSNLANRGELIQLLDGNRNLVDEVRYYDGGRWDGDADGKGSSLELRDPWADNNAPEAWAASDETDQVGWQRFTWSGSGRGPSTDPTRYNEFLLGLLDDGQILIDDITVTESPGTDDARQLIQNGTFESDALGSEPAAWRIIGTQHGSVVADPDNPANKVLLLTASGPTEHMHNNAGTTLKFGDEFPRLNNSSEYEISFRARWVSGSNQLNARLYFNRLGRSLRLDRPVHTGTPGRENSQRVENVGPTYHGLLHEPAVPNANQPVTVRVTADDPNGVAAMTLRYAVAGGAFQSVPMTRGTDGYYRGEIPGQAAETLVQFYVEGRDSAGETSMFPAAGPESRALYRVQDNGAAADQRHTLRILMTDDDARRLHETTNVMSNDRMGTTVIYRESEIFYDVGVRLKGSQRGRDKVVRVGFNLAFDPSQLFRGVHHSIGIDRSGSGDEYSQEEIIVRQIINRAGAGPQIYDDLIHVIAPNSRHTGSAMLNMARYNDIFLNSQYENGADGTAFEYELIYYPTSTVGNDPEGLKRPNPDDVRGVGVSGRGDDKELYRWHFLIENNRAQDDYSTMIDFLTVFGQRQNVEGYFEQIDQVMDVDQWLRAFAVQTLAGIGDSYASGSQHNGIFYVRPGDNRVLHLPWDMDFSFTQGATSSLIGSNDLRKLMSHPSHERAYYGHVMDVINTSFNADYMNPWIDHFDQLVPGQPFFQSFKNYINSRSNFAKTQVERAIAVTPFARTSPESMDVGDATFATVTGTGWVDVRELKVAGRNLPLHVTWTSTTEWQAIVPVNRGTEALTIEAYDFQGNLIGSVPVNVTSQGSSPLRDFLRITELNYNPGAARPGELYVDNDEYEFVELMNTGDAPLDLAGVQFVEIENEGEQEGIRFTFDSQILSPGGSIVVARNAAALASRYGSSFRIALGHGDLARIDAFSGQLANGGETLTLVDPFGGIIQQFAYDDGWHDETDGEGPTLEIVNAFEPNLAVWGREAGWAASSSFGGSPGFAGYQPGDANRDGIFDSADLVLVFQAGKYEDNIPGNASWAEGDWNGDGDFNSRDLVFAFINSDYVGGAPAKPGDKADNLRLISSAIEAVFAEDDN